MIKVKVVDGRGTNRSLQLNDFGELVVGPIMPSTPEERDITVADTASNFFKPFTGKQFIVTGFILNTDKTVGVNGATVEIYEADAVDSITVAKEIFKLEMVKNQIAILNNSVIVTEPGKYINAKSSDVNVFITLLGYYVAIPENN